MKKIRLAAAALLTVFCLCLGAGLAPAETPEALSAENAAEGTALPEAAPAEKAEEEAAAAEAAPAEAPDADPAPVVMELIIEPQEFLLAAGKSRRLTQRYDPPINGGGIALTWSSSDETIATVDANGMVVGVSAGKAIISCEARLATGGILRAQSRAEVIQPVEKVFFLREEKVTLGFGTSAALEYGILPETASVQELEWSSADEKIVSVDEHGIITGNSKGRTRITARAKDGYGASAGIDVEVSPVYAKTAEITIDSPQQVRIPVFYEGENFEEDYQVTLEGDGVTYTVEARKEVAAFYLTPNAVSEETWLIVQDRRNRQYEARILIHVTDSAIGNAQRLSVVSAELVGGSASLTYRFELANHSGEEIGEIGFLVDYRDQFGDTHYLISNTDGTIQNYSYTTMFNILPGQTLPLMGRCDAFRTNDIIREVRLAIFYYRYVESGVKVYIPDSQLYWYSTKTGPMERPAAPKDYLQPDVDTTDRADRITYQLRATLCDLYSYVVKPFCRSYRPGKYVAAVGADGWAKAWGLNAQDVIYGADNMLWTDDPFFLNRAFARVYDGGSVTLKVVRNGEEIEIPISRTR